MLTPDFLNTERRCHCAILE